MALQGDRDTSSGSIAAGSGMGLVKRLAQCPAAGWSNRLARSHLGLARIYLSERYGTK